MIENWNFPANNHGVINGINDAGIESFTGDLYGSLAKEICQNSLDAVLDLNSPVVIDFNLFFIKNTDVIGYNALFDAVSKCKSFWGSLRNNKSINFFNKAETVLGYTNIPVLRISDFNTTGLTGSSDEYNSPWCNLVKSSGVSDKDGASGGSFGIGKSAPFACSNLRTVLYNTLDKNGVKASQGVSRLATFKNDKGEFTQGIGYYGNKERNQALNYIINLDPCFNRTSVGTDVYVLGFIGGKDWIKSITCSILSSFLLALYYGKLEVNVGDLKINKSSLPVLIEEHKSSIKSTYDYYTVLTSNETHCLTFNHNGLGSVSLSILLNVGLNRNVLVTRSNGMKIFDMNSMPAAIHFSGILTLKDESINSYFRQMESPQHDKWQSDRHPDRKQAEKHKTDLYKYVKLRLIELSKSYYGEEVDAEGMGDYLPDEVSTDSSSGDDILEAISNDTNIPKIKIIHRLPISQNMEEDNNGNSRQVVKKKGTVSSHDEKNSFNGGNYGDNSRNDVYSKRNPGSASDDGDTDDIYTYIKVSTPSIRVFQKNNLLTDYRLIFVPTKSLDLGAISVKVLGESSQLTIDITRAFDMSVSLLRLSVKNNYILVPKLTKGKKCIVDFSIKDGNGYPLGVIIHEAVK